MQSAINNFNFKAPDYKPIFEERLRRLRSIRSDETGKTLAAHLLHYKDNPIDFIQDWMITYDPRREIPYMPFILFKRQQEFISWLKGLAEDRSDGLVEKSRDAGVSWLCMAFSVWAFIFSSGIKIGIGSRKEALVDRIGDPDSLLQKARIIIERLPSEFAPTSCDLAFMKFINNDNGASITGEAGDNIGRGGRNKIYFKDESAFYERPDLIEAALSQNSDVKIDVSTPNGAGNPFYKKRFSGKIPVFIFDWRDDPRKDEAWYQKQKNILETWIVAQEIDRDYNASIEGICIPAMYVKATIELDLPPSGAKIAGLDVADEGGDSNVFIARHGPVVTHVIGWKEGTTTQTARRAYHEGITVGIDNMNYDSIGVGAGVKGEFAAIGEDKKDVFLVRGIHTGSSPSQGEYENTGKQNGDMFINLRAELWWKLRRRFEKTYEHVTGKKRYLTDELISIPRHEGLISELSMPLRQFGQNGKIKIESKEDMKKRGVKSPNYADALCLSFAESGFFGSALDKI